MGEAILKANKVMFQEIRSKIVRKFKIEPSPLFLRAVDREFLTKSRRKKEKSAGG